MGYYSDVMFSTDKAGYEEFKSLLPESVAAEWLTDGSVDEDGDSVVFGWYGVKWYEDFPEVKAIMAAFYEASNTYPFQYCNVGEEWGDITCETNEWNVGKNLERHVEPQTSIAIY